MYVRQSSFKGQMFFSDAAGLNNNSWRISYIFKTKFYLSQEEPFYVLFSEIYASDDFHFIRNF